MIGSQRAHGACTYLYVYRGISIYANIGAFWVYLIWDVAGPCSFVLQGIFEVPTDKL